jgi:hypothetical protein
VSRKTLFALLVLVLIVLAPYSFLPSLLGSALARALQSQLGLESVPEVELGSDPAPAMYAGSFSEAFVSAEGVELRGVRAEKVVMDLDPFNVNLVESATSGALSTEQPLSGTLSVELSEENTSRLARLVSAVPVEDVELEEDEIVLRMSLGFGSPTAVRGRMFLRDGELVFEPRQIEGAPAFASTEQLLALTRFAYPVSGLMYGARVSGVEVSKDRLILSGEIQDIPLGGVPAG